MRREINEGLNVVERWNGVNDFIFYGNVYTEVYAGSNGYLSFGQGYGSIPWGTLPDTNNPNNDIMPLGVDKYIVGGATHLYYQTLISPTRFVLQFAGLDECCTTGLTSTFEVILYPNGDILYQYQTVQGTTDTVGVENAAG